MADSRIPEDVQQFITRNIESAEQLDVLVLLHAHPERAWTADELSQAIFSVPQSTARTLVALEARGYAARAGDQPPAWRAAAPPADEQRIAALAAAYRSNRAGVIRYLFSAQPDPVRSLADAFRLRKDG